MNRRNFIRSLGGAVAAAMIPFVKPIHLSAPKKVKQVTAFWYQTSRYSKCLDDQYRKFFEAIVSKNPELIGRFNCGSAAGSESLTHS